MYTPTHNRMRTATTLELPVAGERNPYIGRTAGEGAIPRPEARDNPEWDGLDLGLAQSAWDRAHNLFMLEKVYQSEAERSAEGNQ